MYNGNENKNLRSRSYNIDYRSFYGRDIFSEGHEGKFFDGDTNQDDVNSVNISLDNNIIQKRKKESSFQHIIEYMFKKTIKILVTSLIITIFIVLIVAVFGVVIDIEKREQLISYDNLIWPVVMQDPEPFDQDHPLNKETMLKAGVWDASSRYKVDKGLFDKDGRQIISGQDVKNSIQKLFNVDIDIKESIPDGIFFFNYNVLEDKFYVESISSDQSFIPRTKNCEKMGNGLIKLTVEYLIPQNQFDDVMKIDKEKKVEKVMEYVLSVDEESKRQYISKIYNIDQL